MKTAILILGMSLSLWGQNAAPRQTPATPFETEAQRARQEAEQLARTQAEAEERDWDTKIFTVRYVDPSQLRAALNMFRARMQANQDLHVLGVRAPKEIMPAIEDAIKRLDVPSPSKTAELTIYVLMGTDQPEPNSNIPGSLQPVLTQLRNVLSYKSYQLVDTLIARATDKRSVPTDLMGTLPTGGAYNFRARFRIDTDGKVPVLRLDDMQFTLRIGPQNTPVSISTEVEIPKGQQIVVGKATYGDKAFILVMSAQFPN